MNFKIGDYVKVGTSGGKIVAVDPKEYHAYQVQEHNRGRLKWFPEWMLIIDESQERRRKIDIVNDL